MQVVSAIVSRKQAVEMLWVAHDNVEIYHSVKMARRPNPRVHCLSISLTPRAWMVVS